MSDNQENQPVEGAEILRLLKEIRAQGARNGELLSNCLAELQSAKFPKLGEVASLDAIGEQLAGVAVEVARIGGVVDQAAPLLNSGPARALAGGGVLQMIRGTRKASQADG